MLAVRQRCRHRCRHLLGVWAPIPTAAEAAALAQAGTALAFRFDAARWTTADRIAGGATVVLFISLFLPWFRVSASFGNFTSSSSVDALTAVNLLLVLIGMLIMPGGGSSLVKVSWDFGAFLGLAAAVVAVAPLAAAPRSSRHSPRHPNRENSALLGASCSAVLANGWRAAVVRPSRTSSRLSGNL